MLFGNFTGKNLIAKYRASQIIIRSGDPRWPRGLYSKGAFSAAAAFELQVLRPGHENSQ